MIYVFSNAHSYENQDEYKIHLMSSFKADENDKVIMLNTCIPLQSAPDFFSKFDVSVLCRGFNIGPVISYWGIDVVSRRRSKFHNFYSCHHMSGNLEINKFDFKTDKYDTIRLDDYSFFTNYKGEQVPTTGYIAYHIFNKIYNDDVTLVNFYGSANNTTPKDKCHNWDYEEEFFKDKRKIFI